MFKNLKGNTTNILLVICIISFTNAAFFLWYFSVTTLNFNASDFNNIFSPIATTVTAIAFIYLAFQQNSIIVSQNLKPHIDKEFERVHNVLSRPVLESLGPENNTINCAAIIERRIKQLNSNEEFQKDLWDFNKGIFHDLDYFQSKSYYEDVKFILTYSFFGIIGFGSVEGFIERIENSKLHKDDKKAYLFRIKKEFISNYMSVIHKFRFSKNDLVPDVNAGATHIKFISISDTSFSHFYETFKEKFY
jgi:hypothetical protein